MLIKEHCDCVINSNHICLILLNNNLIGFRDTTFSCTLTFELSLRLMLFHFGYAPLFYKECVHNVVLITTK